MFVATWKQSDEINLDRKVPGSLQFLDCALRESELKKEKERTKKQRERERFWHTVQKSFAFF